MFRKYKTDYRCDFVEGQVSLEANSRQCLKRLRIQTFTLVKNKAQ